MTRQRVQMPAWVRRDHPVVRLEARHWGRSRPWRAAQGLVWGGSLTFILVPALCSVLFSLQSQFTSPAEAILTLGGVFAVGLALLSTLAVWFSNISASILGATLIARERESQTWPFLRLTNLSALDIAGGKFMALFYTLLGPLRLISGLRLLALLAGAVTLALAYLASGLSTLQVAALFMPLLDELGLSAGQWLGLVLFSALTAAWIGLSWLAEPFFGLLYYGIIGLTVSTFVRSRGAAIVLVVAAHFCLALGVYAPVSQLSSLLLTPLLFTGGSAHSQTAAFGFVVLTVLLQIGLQTLLPWGVMAACALFTVRRLERLSD
jgi:hypothetical protein